MILAKMLCILENHRSRDDDCIKIDAITSYCQLTDKLMNDLKEQASKGLPHKFDLGLIDRANQLGGDVFGDRQQNLFMQIGEDVGDKKMAYGTRPAMGLCAKLAPVYSASTKNEFNKAKAELEAHVKEMLQEHVNYKISARRNPKTLEDLDQSKVIALSAMLQLVSDKEKQLAGGKSQPQTRDKTKASPAVVTSKPKAPAVKNAEAPKAQPTAQPAVMKSVSERVYGMAEGVYDVLFDRLLITYKALPTKDKVKQFGSDYVMPVLKASLVTAGMMAPLSVLVPAGILSVKALAGVGAVAFISEAKCYHSDQREARIEAHTPEKSWREFLGEQAEKVGQCFRR